MEVETPHGPARVELREPAAEPWAVLALGHGAGGGVDAPDLVAATEAALGAGCLVALVEQPYRVAGRRSAAPAKQLDAAWLAVCARLRAEAPSGRWSGGLPLTRGGRSSGGLPLIAGGRSSGARVACRTAAASGAVAVLCLAFPVHPPGKPEKSRLDELDAVGVPVLVVQGERDPFGMPPAAPGRTVVRIRGDHGLKADLPAVGAAVGDWVSALRS